MRRSKRLNRPASLSPNQLASSPLEFHHPRKLSANFSNPDSALKVLLLFRVTVMSLQTVFDNLRADSG